MTHAGEPPIEMTAIATEMQNSKQVVEHDKTSGIETRAPSLSLARIARAMLSARRRIGQHFDAALFADPARDILLDLFAAGEERRKISVTSCCVAAAVPTTTALRWIELLKQKGIIVATPDERDGRRILLSLSEQSHRAMINYLSAIAGGAGELRATLP